MKCYFPDKPLEEIKKTITGSKMEVIIQKPMTEIPISIPTIPYYNSMALNMLLNAEPGNVPNIPWENTAYNIILVVGAGGTGGFLIRDLARYISTLPYSQTTLMLVMDADEVEPKNLRRQNFINSDVGKNKAEVMVSRYSKAFGVRMVHMPEHLTDKNIDTIFNAKFCRDLVVQHLGGNLTDPYGVNFIVASCVDNNKTRVLISNKLGLIRDPQVYPTTGGVSNSGFFDKPKEGSNVRLSSITWIDSGNETNNGQVICFYDSLFTSRMCNSIGITSGGIHSQGRHSDAYQSVYRNASQYLYSYLTAPVRPDTFPSIHWDSSYRVKSTTTIDEITSKAAKFWMLHHQMGGTDKDAYKEWLKPIKELNPFHKDFDNACKFIVARSARDHKNLLMNITFPVTFIYPTIFDQAGDKLNTELSCAERAVVDPQNIMINIQAASFMMNYFSKILASNPKNALLNSLGVSWHNNHAKEFYMTESNIKDVFTQMIKHMKPTVGGGSKDYKVRETEGCKIVSV